MQHANQMPMVIDLVREMGSPALIEHEEKLLSSLTPDLDPSLGVYGLPEEVRRSAVYVLSYYQTCAYLAAYGIVDKALVALPIHYRLERIWDALCPYVHGERVRRGGQFTFQKTILRTTSCGSSARTYPRGDRTHYSSANE
jgi:hypothetical protein